MHACSTGTYGCNGSAVFSRTESLVGVNFFYTTSKGVDYGSGILHGGLVSAIDLQTIKKGFESMYPHAKLEGKVDHFVFNEHVYQFVHLFIMHGNYLLFCIFSCC